MVACADSPGEEDSRAPECFCEENAGRRGSPKPVARVGGEKRPARPKMVSSAVPMRRARHSAGGGREAKRLRPVVAILAVAPRCESGCCGSLVGSLGIK